jgi:hypothetical protein
MPPLTAAPGCSLVHSTCAPVREDMLALILEQEDIDDGWEDRVPDREWAFVIRRASPRR